MHNRRRTRWLAATVLSAALLTGCSDLPEIVISLPEPVPGTESTGTESGTVEGGGTVTAPVAPTGDAATALAGVPVKGRAPKTGYDRDQFGPAWSDTDRNGCDQRNDVLTRDLVDETYKPDTQDCVVLTGTLDDPYTGQVVPFARGQDTSSDVQIDHVVALSNAWQTGAQQLDEPTRQLFANDPLNLMAVDGATNQSKSDGDAATWLPPDRSFWCTYVARQVAVKATYGLWMTRAEHDTISGILGGCPGQPLPTP